MKIEVRNLTKQFNKKEILKGINISFQSGNIYCLSGPNGSGKSIFLNLLCGNDEPSSGEILLNGKSIFKKTLFFNKRKQLVDNTIFLPSLTGYENLKMIAKKNKNIMEDDILVALKKVNLIDCKDQQYCEYSFGMRQRLIIAKVLMEDPKIIILDDPFNGVDDALRVIHAVNPVEHAFSDVDHYRGENHACDHRHENHYEYGLADFVFLEIERSKEECQCPRDDVHDHSPKDLAA